MSLEVVFDGPMGPSFLAELSQPITIGMKDADPSLVQVMSLMANEMQASRCGQPLFINRAGDILWISLMRHLTSRPQQASFLALSDPRIAKSLVAMHPTCASLDIGIAGALGRHVANVICQQLQRGDEGFAWKVFGKFAARHCKAIGAYRNWFEKNCGPDRLRQSFYAVQGTQPHGLTCEKVRDFSGKALKIQVASAVSCQ
jgi:hypothetical protein